MRTNFMNRFVLLLACTGLSACACGLESGSVDGTASGRDSLTAAASATGWNAMSLSVDGSDKEISVIGISKASGASEVVAAFADASPGDDRWSFTSRYCPLPETNVGTPRIVTLEGSCQSSSCGQSIAGFSGQSQFLLQGFRLLTAGTDTEQEVTSIAVVPDPVEGSITVAFSGDQTLSTGFTYRIDYTLVPLPAFTLGTVSGEGPVIEFPADALAGDPDERFISGFSFVRPGSSGPRRLASFGIDLRRGNATFADGDGGEPVRWRVQYLVPAL